MIIAARALRRWWVVAAAATLVACGRQHHGALPAGGADAQSGGRDQGSIYDLDLALTDQDGRRLALADLRGRVTIAAMMYSSCKSVCPRVTEDMKGIERQLPEAEKDRVRFALFSLDPGRDTPAALRRFATDHGLDLARWRLLATSEEGVRDLAAVLGVKYQVGEQGEIAHSAMIFVIDRDGVVLHRQVGLNQDARELIAALERARP